MAKSLFLVLLFSGASLVFCLDYRLTNLFSLSEPKKCLKPGLFCETCSSLVLCIENGDGSWYKEPLENCTKPSLCVDGTCTNETSDPFCTGLAKVTFKCRTTGIFPDPFYCNKFVLCVEDSYGDLQPFLNECDDGFRYNVRTSLCDIPSEECQEGVYPVPLCDYLGQNGALTEKPQIFYICEDIKIDERKFFYPVLNVCPGGQIYHDYMCGDVTTTTSTWWT